MPAMGSHSVVSNAKEAEALFDLARESANASDFAAKLQAAGLMPSSGGDSSGGSGSSSGGSSSDSQGGEDSKADGGGGGGTEVYRVPQLSRELAHKHARDGIIIVTWWVLHIAPLLYGPVGWVGSCG